MPTTYGGGVIASGTYFLTSETIYTGATATPGSVQQTFIIDATAQTLTAVDTEPSTGTAFVAGTYATASSMLTITLYCGTGPDGGTVTVPGGKQGTPAGYTVSGNTVTLFDTGSDLVEVYTKQ
jgi:hypothetical protein